MLLLLLLLLLLFLILVAGLCIVCVSFLLFFFPFFLIMVMAMTIITRKVICTLPFLLLRKSIIDVLDILLCYLRILAIQSIFSVIAGCKYIPALMLDDQRVGKGEVTCDFILSALLCIHIHNSNTYIIKQNLPSPISKTRSPFPKGIIGLRCCCCCCFCLFLFVLEFEFAFGLLFEVDNLGKVCIFLLPLPFFVAAAAAASLPRGPEWALAIRAFFCLGIIQITNICMVYILFVQGGVNWVLIINK